MKDWSATLESRVLPAMALTVASVKKLLDSPSANNADFQNVILRDPGFTLAIFRKFSTTSSASHEPPSNLAHAISLLGLGVVSGCTGELPILRKVLQGTARQGLYGCYSRANHAAAYVTHWAKQQHDPNPDELRIAALLRGCGEMMMWAYAKDEMKKVLLLTRKGHSLDTASMHVLGFRLDELGLELSKRWKLPLMTQHALQLYGAFERRPLSVMIASGLADASSRSWFSRETGELLELTAELLDTEPEQAAIEVHREAAETARDLAGLPLPVSIEDLLQYKASGPVARQPSRPVAASRQSESSTHPSAPATAPVDPAPVPAETATPQHAGEPNARRVGERDSSQAANTPPPEAAPVTHAETTASTADPGQAGAPTAAAVPVAERADRTDVNRDTEADRSHPETNSSKKATVAPASNPRIESHNTLLISRVMNNLKQNAGLDRIMFAVLSPDKRRLVSRFVMSEKKQDRLHDFSVDCSSKHLFTLLLAKQQGFWLNADNAPKYAKLIPQDAVLFLSSHGFYISSLHVNKRAIGILYADCNQADGLKPATFIHFKKLSQRLCNQLQQ